jgi:MFS family permease
MRAWASMPASDIRLLLRRPGYGRYLLAVVASRATGEMFSVAGVLLVLQRTGSIVLAGVTVAAATLPGALSGPFLGAWLDVARSRRRLLVLDRLVTIVALGALLLLAGHAPNWVILVVAVAYGSTAPLSAGGFSSILPEIAGPQLLEVANMFEASSLNAAFIVGPALAGLIAGLAGPAVAIEVQLGVSVVLVALIAPDRIYELRPPPSDLEHRPFLTTVSEGMRSLLGIPRLRSHALASVVYVAAWGSLIVSFPLYAERVHAGAAAAGYLWAAIAFGSMLSAFLFRELALRLAPNVLLVGTFLAMGASVALWPLANGLAGALALVAFTGMIEGPALVALVGIRQRLAPAHLRGQVFATIFSLDLAASAVGSAVAGPLHADAGTVVTLFAFGALTLVSGLLNYGTGDAQVEPVEHGRVAAPS